MNITPHAQVQTIDGTTYEFQPEHLMCDECWSVAAGEGMTLAHVYGSAMVWSHDENFKPTHCLTITIKKGHDQ